MKSGDSRRAHLCSITGIAMLHALVGALFVLAALMKGIAMPSASAKAKAEDNYYRRAQLEELARKEFPPLIVMEDEDGKQYTVGNPMTESDELVETLAAIGQDQVAIARARMDAEMGAGAFDDFKAAGGQSWMVFVALRDEQQRLQSATPGSGAPTR